MLAASIAFVVAGFAILLYSGDCLVRGALSAAYKSRVSPLMVGIVIVGFGTSLPEIMIAVTSSLAGSPGLAHGNIIGSNIANVWLVLALPALLFPLATTAPRMRITALFMLAATAAWIGLTLVFGLNAYIGAGFLGAILLYTLVSWLVSRTDTTEDTPEELVMQAKPIWKLVTLVLIGIVGLPLGARLLIDGGIALAAETGMGEEIVGLTLLAVGSSLPELGAGLAAVWRKQGDVAMGNILGSNIFNILAAGGAIALLGPQQLAVQFHDYSHWAMALSALMVTVVILFHRRLGWFTALVFLALYAVYLAGLVQGWTFESVAGLFLER